ncbi:hypothetical protein ACFSQ7_03545 [Paenibacillus rhizoplanae]
MDAIRAKEWRMFIFLRELTDERAFKVFTIFASAAVCLFLLFFLDKSTSVILHNNRYVFLILHSIAHFFL